MGLLEHAKRELELAGYDLDSGSAEQDKMDSMMVKHLIEMVEKFAEAEHSGFSANYAIGALMRLLNQEPLTPLTGEDDEWEDRSEVSGFPMWQNKRYGLVFKDESRAWILHEDVEHEIEFPFCFGDFLDKVKGGGAKKRPRQKGDPSYTKGRRLHKWETSWVPDAAPGRGEVPEWTCTREGCSQKKYSEREKVPDCTAPRGSES